MANAITRLITFLSGELVGVDSHGNRYYQHKRAPTTGRRRRWIVYAGKDAEPSLIPTSHYNWLHYTAEDFPANEDFSHRWQKKREPNYTGDARAWRPSGHLYQESQRPKATGDYQAWKPANSGKSK